MSTTAQAVRGSLVEMEVQGFSPEFTLLLACLRWPLEDAGLERIAGLCGSVADWPHLLHIAARHRVFGLVWRALQRSRCAMPPAISAQFQQAAAQTAHQALFLSAESVRLSAMFDQAGVEATFLKGAVVAVLAYRDVAVRHAKDIDLLVGERSVPDALVCLRNAGYAPLLDLDAVPPRHRALWFRYAKSIDLRHVKTGLLLELHWRLTDLPLVEAFHAARQTVSVAPGRTLPALPPDLLLAYLCLHGASHGWMRLKWLADVHALLRCGKDLDVTYKNLVKLGAGRSAGQAFLLCSTIFGLHLPPALQADLQHSIVLRVLRRTPVWLYRRGHEVKEVDDLPFGTTSVYLSRMLLSSNVRAFLLELRTWAFRPDELLKTRLPRSLAFLFPFVRVAAWARARMQHGGRSAPQA